MSTEQQQQGSFFRQSGWLMFATVVGGLLMWAVHFLSKAMPEREYGDFGAFLALVLVLPAIPAQMVFAQQTARAVATNQPGQISGLLRKTITWTFVVWLAVAALALIFQKTLLATWKVTNPAALWFTLPVLFLSMVIPMFCGVLQGAQNFLWLGWTLMLNSLGRLVAATFAVLVLGAYAAGVLSGVLFGLLLALGVALYNSREFWMCKPEPFGWKNLRLQTVPLVLGFVGFQILFTADTMFVKAYFAQNEAGYYVSAGTLARALLWLVLPLAAVMFPKLVHSAAKSEKSNLLGLVMFGTAVLSTAGAIGLAVMGPIVIRIVYKESYIDVATMLLPWYGVAMIPLALGNVLLNQLLARPLPKLTLGICIMALSIAYMYALTRFNSSLISVLQTMGVFNLVFLAICGYFTWQERRAGTVQETSL